MSWLDDMRQKAQKAIQAGQKEVKQYQNKEYVNAVLGVCALVANADGHVDDSEVMTTVAFIQQHKDLKVFDAAYVEKQFKHYVSELRRGVFGKAAVVEDILKVRKDTGKAASVIYVACEIGASDGNFDPNEQKVCSDVCKQLGLDPTSFNLPA